jgi:hypothetical protein
MTVELPARVLARWPPRSRTERYRLIRAAPSTGWVVASGRWKCRSSGRLSPHGFSRPVAAPAAHLPWRRTEGTIPSAYADPPSKRSPRPGGFVLHVDSPAWCEKAGDSGGRSARCSAPFRRPYGFQPQPVPWPVHPPSEEGGLFESHEVTRASASNGARRLAGSPSLSAEPRIRTVILLALNKAPLSSWASSACE